MNSAPDAERLRLRFLRDIVEREAVYLAETDRRLFVRPMDAATIAALPGLPDLGERVDAFVVRLSRLQDNAAEKLLPALLAYLLEPVGPVRDNLDRAQRRGWVASADDWATLRKLRNRLIHEYVGGPGDLAQALNDAHATVPLLLDTTRRLIDEIDARLPASAPDAPPPPP